MKGLRTFLERNEGQATGREDSREGTHSTSRRNRLLTQALTVLPIRSRRKHFLRIDQPLVVPLLRLGRIDRPTDRAYLAERACKLERPVPWRAASLTKRPAGVKKAGRAAEEIGLTGGLRLEILTGRLAATASFDRQAGAEAPQLIENCTKTDAANAVIHVGRHQSSIRH